MPSPSSRVALLAFAMLVGCATKTTVVSPAVVPAEPTAIGAFEIPELQAVPIEGFHMEPDRPVTETLVERCEARGLPLIEQSSNEAVCEVYPRNEVYQWIRLRAFDGPEEQSMTVEALAHPGQEQVAQELGWNMAKGHAYMIADFLLMDRFPFDSAMFDAMSEAPDRDQSIRWSQAHSRIANAETTVRLTWRGPAVAPQGCSWTIEIRRAVDRHATRSE
jgi:hypothetical protein